MNFLKAITLQNCPAENTETGKLAETNIRFEKLQETGTVTITVENLRVYLDKTTIERIFKYLDTIV